MQTPVIFLSFANSKKKPLPYLQKEGEQLQQLFTTPASEERIQLHYDPFTSPAKITDFFLQYNNRITLFHYGGHANSKALLLEEQSANSDGLAHQLAQQKNLQLVFLNGCSTRRQVQLLLDLGIPAVIATQALIGDKRASIFATTFYKALVANQTIKAAFEHAAAAVKTISDIYPRIYRDTGLRDGETKDNVFTWGLYTKEEEVLNLKLIPEKKKEYTKNILEETELEIEGDTHIGDIDNTDTNTYSEKNVVRKSKIKVKGGFRLGDGKL